jgi:hypothetical protein
VIQVTQGISPKVKLPTWALAILGVLLIAVGFLIGDDNLVKIGGSLLGGAGIVFQVGYKAGPGEVKPVIGPSSDVALGPASLRVAQEGQPPREE